MEHSGNSLAKLVDWLRRQTLESPSVLAIAIEVPRGAVVETLLEHGFAVFSIIPKQLDRFRDRYSPAGAKGDRRDAFVLADSLRTDMHCFHAVRLDEPAMMRLRELSRLEDEISQELSRATNRLREQFHRFFPQLLQLCESAYEPWLWILFELAPRQPARPSSRKQKSHASSPSFVSDASPPRCAPSSRPGPLHWLPELLKPLPNTPDAVAAAAPAPPLTHRSGTPHQRPTGTTRRTCRWPIGAS